MLYPIAKSWVRLAMPFFARRIKLVHPELLNQPGPLLLACNHPNSFLDAVLMGILMKHPVYFMTRGDVFKKAWVRKIFAGLKMIPIFRMRDGKDKLSLNEETFVKSVEVLRNNGILLIFVEGFCVNQTELQLPLKKGAPRIIHDCWQKDIPVKVLPVWLQYSSYNRYGKTIEIRLGEMFGKEIAADLNATTVINAVNGECTKQLLHLSNNFPFVKPVLPEFVRRLLFIPAMLGAVLHAPVYLPCHALAAKISKDTVHFDSILLASLIVCYPLYLLIVTGILLCITHLWWPLWILIVFPPLAKAYQLWKK